MPSFADVITHPNILQRFKPPLLIFYFEYKILETLEWWDVLKTGYIWVAEEVPNPGEKAPGASGALELTEVPWGDKPLLPVPQHGTCIHALSVQQE